MRDILARMEDGSMWERPSWQSWYVLCFPVSIPVLARCQGFVEELLSLGNSRYKRHESGVMFALREIFLRLGEETGNAKVVIRPTFQAQ